VTAPKADNVHDTAIRLEPLPLFQTYNQTRCRVLWIPVRIRASLGFEGEDDLTKETVGYVRLEWTCPNCRSRNSGPEKTCASCGAAQPEDVEFEQPAQETLISDETEIASAKAGPDIHCAYCGARNPAGTETCSQCGADLTEGEARASQQVLGAHRARPAKRVPCPSCGALNPGTALECSQCGASMARSAPAREAHAKPAQAQRSSCTVIAGIAIAAVIALGVIFVILSMRTEAVTATVQGVSWTRTIAIQQLGPVEYEGWRDEIPSSAEIGACTDKVHHMQDEPAADANKICGTPYTVDTGSGYGKVVQDCQYEVYEDWCDYTVQEWLAVDEVKVEGSDLTPQWPALALAGGQREGPREERYECTFDADGKRLTYTTSDPAKFARCAVGSRWVLKVNTFNAVTGMESPE
jgi:ribosomal protein L40E